MAINPQMIISLLQKFFPNINELINRGQEQIKGVDNNFSSVANFIRSSGIMNEQIDKVANLIITHPQAKILCKTFGTTPVFLANDIRRLKNPSNNTNSQNAPKMVSPKTQGVRKFTRL